jgi:hypothetical protein
MPSLVHSKSLLSPSISLKALFEVFDMRNALEVLKIYLIYMFRGMLQAEIRYCGSRINMLFINTKALSPSKLKNLLGKRIRQNTRMG